MVSMARRRRRWRAVAAAAATAEEEKGEATSEHALFGADLIGGEAHGLHGGNHVVQLVRAHLGEHLVAMHLDVPAARRGGTFNGSTFNSDTK